VFANNAVLVFVLTSASPNLLIGADTTIRSNKDWEFLESWLNHQPFSESAADLKAMLLK